MFAAFILFNTNTSHINWFYHVFKFLINILSTKNTTIFLILYHFNTSPNSLAHHAYHLVNFTPANHLTHAFSTHIIMFDFDSS